MKRISLLLTLFMAIAVSGADRKNTNYDESKVPQYTLPDPLVFENGREVRNARQWEKRRGEIMDLFREHMYGYEPAAPKNMDYEVLKVIPDMFDGLATMKEVRIDLDESGEHYCIMLMFVPNNRKGPAPAFLGMNFKGNHATSDIADISAPTQEQMEDWGPGIKLEERNSNGRRWPFRYILEQGYATCTIHCNDCEPDGKDNYDYGIRKVYDKGDRRDDSWGNISAWAWSLSRAMDYLENDPDVDSERVAVHGHSRLGKVALWAGAMDRRFALVISNDSGCSGAALSRRVYGERLYTINRSFPHWFCDNYKKYNENEAALPFDQHQLIAMIAPRPVYVASASEDRWADPYGEYLSLVHATPVYRLLGYDGFEDTRMPSLESPMVKGRMGHHIRHGKHDILLYDWQQFIAFADGFLK